MVLVTGLKYFKFGIFFVLFLFFLSMMIYIHPPILFPVVFDLPFSVDKGLKIGSGDVTLLGDCNPSAAGLSLVSISALVDASAVDGIVPVGSLFGGVARSDAEDSGERARDAIDAGDIALEDTDWSSSGFIESLSIKSVDAGRLSLSFGSSMIGECVLYAKADIEFSGCERYSDDIDSSSFFSSFTLSSPFSSSGAPSAPI